MTTQKSQTTQTTQLTKRQALEQLNAEKPSMRPSLEDCQNELERTIRAFSIMVGDIYGIQGTIALLQGNSEKDDLLSVIAGPIVSELNFIKCLPDAFAYAFNGDADVVSGMNIEVFPNYFDALNDFLKMCDDNEWFDSVCNDPAVVGPEYKAGSVRQLTDMGMARVKLDQDDESLQSRDIALLAGISERSVQNAFSVKGPSQLKSKKILTTSFVSSVDARAWLADKKGFTPTVGSDEKPKASGTKQLNSQAKLLSFVSSMATMQVEGVEPSIALTTVLIQGGMSVERAERIGRGETSIEISDAIPIAKAVKLPPHVLVEQILRINHPAEAELILQS